MEERRGDARITIRLGPLGLSLLAAAITAVGLAAVSLADSGSGNASNGRGNGRRSRCTRHRPAAAGCGDVPRCQPLGRGRQKMEDFRKCMEDNGAPGPPTHIDPSDGPPKPPSAADREKIQKAYEACKDKLP